METNSLKNAAARIKGESKSGDAGEKKPVITATQVARAFLEKYGDVISEAVGDRKEAVRLIGHLVNVIASNPNLIRAVHESPESLMGAILQSCQLGLVPNTPLGFCFLVPYNEKDKVASAREGRDIWRHKVNFQFGYQGVLRLCYNSGEITDVDAMEVYEKDYFDYQLGTEKHLIHRPFEGDDPGKVVRYYAIVSLKSGGKIFRVWSAAKVRQHAIQFAKSWNEKYKKFFGPWDDNFDSMARKTVLLAALKYAPKSDKLAAQLAADSTTKSVTASTGGINALMLPNEDYDSDGRQLESRSADDEDATRSLSAPDTQKPQPAQEREPELLDIR